MPNLEMKFSVEGPNDGPFNMEEDCSLLRSAEEGNASARFYKWDGTWVSIGRFQDESGAVKPGFRSVRRPTGGAAVLHGHDLTVSIALPLSVLGTEKRKIKEVYRQVVSPFVRAFSLLGIPAVLGEVVLDGSDEKVSHVTTPFCFAKNSGNDVVHAESGQKLMGCALRVTDRAVLLQASFPTRKPAISAVEAIYDGQDLEVIPCDGARWINTVVASWRDDLNLDVSLDFLSQHDLFFAIRIALWNAWDPIGVNDSPEASDEYDGYAGLILNASDRGKLLARIREEDMGGVGSSENDASLLAVLPDDLRASC